MPAKKPQPKLKKAAKKAALRRQGTLAVQAKPAAPHVFPQQENAQLHKTSRSISEDARGQERLMEKKRWSHA